jgi:lysophospholipase L1-like esterase
MGTDYYLYSYRNTDVPLHISQCKVFLYLFVRGTVSHISEFCLDVVRQEVQASRPPDCVVILCGINDLKQIVSNPITSSSPARTFREKLDKLLVDIRELCGPGTRVVLPALPMQMIHYNSPVNIFPLSFFLDTIVGFWESQKKVVVDAFPSEDVMYVPLSGAELHSWYHRSDEDDDKEEAPRSLTAADGVHPNTKCYSKWASSVARFVYSKTTKS